MTAITIVTVILAILGLAFAYWKTVAGTAISFIALVCANFIERPAALSHDTFSFNGLLFWGIAAVIVLGISFLNSGTKVLTRLSRAYPLSGAIVGAFLGFLVNPITGAVIIGGAIGATLGAFAFTRTPRGRTSAISSQRFLDYLASAGLSSVVIASMSVIACRIAFL